MVSRIKISVISFPFIFVIIFYFPHCYMMSFFWNPESNGGWWWIREYDVIAGVYQEEWRMNEWEKNE